MSDTAGGGDGGGGGQDEGADNEPPQQALLPGEDSSGVGGKSEEGLPPSAKRTKMSDEDQEQEPFEARAETCGETPEQTGSCLQEDISSIGQSTCNCSNKTGDARRKSGGYWLLSSNARLCLRDGAAAMWGGGRTRCGVCRWRRTRILWKWRWVRDPFRRRTAEYRGPTQQQRVFRQPCWRAAVGGRHISGVMMINQAPAVAPEQIMFRQKDHFKSSSLAVLCCLCCVFRVGVWWKMNN